MMGVLELLGQLAPPHAYAEVIHQSGLFAFILKALYDDEVCILNLRPCPIG